MNITQRAVELTLLLNKIVVSLFNSLFKWIREILKRPHSSRDLKILRYFWTFMNSGLSWILNFHEFWTLMNSERFMFFFVCYLCLAYPSASIIFHRWNFCSNGVNYISNIKKIFLLGNFLLFFRITKYL